MISAKTKWSARHSRLETLDVEPNKMNLWKATVRMGSNVTSLVHQRDCMDVGKGLAQMESIKL